MKNRIESITQNCQALSISQSLNLSVSLRDRADTKITLPHYRTLILKCDTSFESSAQALLISTLNRVN